MRAPVVFIVLLASAICQEEVTVSGDSDSVDPSPRKPPPGNVRKRSTGSTTEDDTSCHVAKKENITPEQRRQFIDAHNKGRADEGATNEMLISWDPTLSLIAQAWADQCTWTHKYLYDCNGNRLGQNMYMSLNTDMKNMTYVSEVWLNERDNYHYETNSCDDKKICGHYKQAVWAKTNRIGCGINVCPTVTVPDKSPWSDTMIVVCDYSPPGNVEGVRPNVKGPPCNSCPVTKGYRCILGLCIECVPKSDSSGECECKKACSANSVQDTDMCTCVCNEGFYGVECDKKCENAFGDDSCNYWKDLGYCEDGNAFYSFMAGSCPKCCGMC